jgi:hypothetical protein
LIAQSKKDLGFDLILSVSSRREADPLSPNNDVKAYLFEVTAVTEADRLRKNNFAVPESQSNISFSPHYHGSIYRRVGGLSISRKSKPI